MYTEGEVTTCCCCCCGWVLGEDDPNPTLAFDKPADAKPPIFFIPITCHIYIFYKVPSLDEANSSSPNSDDLSVAADVNFEKNIKKKNKK